MSTDEAPSDPLSSPAPGIAEGAVAAIAVAPILAMIALAAHGLPVPAQSAYARIVLEEALGERRVQNAVSLVNFDVRGLDTLGEELILLAAVTGTSILLRPAKKEKETPARGARPDRPSRPESEVVRLTGTWLAIVALVFGAELAAHGHLSPGGGFQGGAIAGTAMVMIYLARGYQRFERLGRERHLLPLEALGALAFVGVAGYGLATGGALLENVLPFGEKGSLLSGGTIFVLDLAVGVEVAGGIGLVLVRFLHQVEALVEGAH